MQPRERTVAWHDPVAAAASGRGLSGLEHLQAIVAGDIPPPPIAALLGFELVAVDEGRAVFAVYPGEYHYNPIGVVHGGLAATVLDSAMACAVHSTLPAGTRYTTLEFKVNLVRALTADVGRLRAVAEVMHGEGRIATAQARLVDDSGTLYAHATETCLL